MDIVGRDENIIGGNQSFYSQVELPGALGHEKTMLGVWKEVLLSTRKQRVHK